MDLAGLTAKINQVADAKLDNEVSQLIDPIRAIVSETGFKQGAIVDDVFDEDGERINLSRALELLERCLKDALRDKRRDAAAQTILDALAKSSAEVAEIMGDAPAQP